MIFSVSDSGPGVPAEHRDAIFGKYETVQGRSKSGHGLGLAFCRLVADAHGGWIRCLANEPSGSRFEVGLPGAGPATASESEVAGVTSA